MRYIDRIFLVLKYSYLDKYVFENEERGLRPACGHDGVGMQSKVIPYVFFIHIYNITYHNFINHRNGTFEYEISNIPNSPPMGLGKNFHQSCEKFV